MKKSGRRGAGEGARLVAEFRGSGFSQRRFAAQAGVKVGTLQYWLRKEKGGALGVVLPSPGFVELIGARSPGTGGVAMELASGVTLRFETLPSPSYLGQVAAAFAGYPSEAPRLERVRWNGSGGVAVIRYCFQPKSTDQSGW